MCGMCLPHCPTYHVYQTEAESPRGRISLIQAYAQGRLENTVSMQAHLDHCLGCMACEAMCPSRVPYGQLLDRMRAENARQGDSAGFIQRKLLDITQTPGRLEAGSRLLKWSRGAGLDKLVSVGLKAAGKGHISRLLEHNHVQTLETHYPASHNRRGSVALFSGCMGTSFDSSSLHSGIRLLNRLGYDVEVPKMQGCCGALHQHNGQIDQAQQLAGHNRQVFSQLDVDHIVYVSNGCGDSLQHSLSGQPVSDIMSFVLHQAELTVEQLLPLEARVLLHESCSSTNKLGIGGIAGQLIDRIPGIKVLGFESARYCCGAGGSHQLTHPALSEQLRAIKLEEIRQKNVDYLLTDNLGCGLNFRVGLEQLGIELPIMHPITLLSRQLK